MSGKGEYPPAPEPLAVPVYDDHTHLEIDPEVPGIDPGEALDRAEAVGVRGVVQVGTDLDSSRWSAELAERDRRVLAAVALHPNEAPLLAARGALDEHLAGIDALAARPRVRAIGETGLDRALTTDEAGRRAQLYSFEAHADIAKRHGLAMQIHDRDAHAEMLAALDRVGAPERTVLHCFSGDAAFAREAVERGWFLSFAGTVTFKNAPALREALAVTPLDRILVETDAPFLTPVPYRGRPNSPYLVPYTVRAMAETLQLGVDELCTALAATTERVYGSWDEGVTGGAA